jgi:AcrR family transcriptional regulator
MRQGREVCAVFGSLIWTSIHTGAYPYASVWKAARQASRNPPAERRDAARHDEKNTMAITRTPRTSWIEEGLKALAAGGPDAVRVETLAQALGVTKGGFYWQFDGRVALLEDMLDTWERVVIDEVIERVEAGGGDARARLGRLFALAASTRSLEGVSGSIARNLMEIELAVRDWARRDPAVAARLRRVDNRRMEYMRARFADFCADEEDVEARCMAVMSLFVANRFIAAEHGRRGRTQVVNAALRRLLE